MPNLTTWQSRFDRNGHAGLARLATWILRIPSPKRVFVQHRSTIYAAAAPLVPAAAAWLTRPATLLVPGLAVLLGLAAAGLLPRLARWSVRLEDGINLRLGRVTPARLLRPIFQPVPVLPALAFAALSGPVAVATPSGILLLLGAGSAFHAAAIRLAYRGHGDRNTNTILAYTLSAWLAGGAAAWPALSYAAAGACVLLLLYLLSGALADLRTWRYPRNGIGVFFGTFNPVHKTHLQILETALRERELARIYVQSTTVPRLHRTALENGEIAMTREAGMRVYAKTAIADPAKNYFPTGNRFYDYAVRRAALEAAIADAGLADRVEILDLTEIYDRDGFFGVLREIRRRHQDLPLHGLHGTDTGGMWVRNIFDQSGIVYACPTIRTDNVSATAIRNGAVGMTSPTVERFLAAARASEDFRFPNGFLFRSERAKQDQNQ